MCWRWWWCAVWPTPSSPWLVSPQRETDGEFLKVDSKNGTTETAHPRHQTQREDTHTPIHAQHNTYTQKRTNTHTDIDRYTSNGLLSMACIAAEGNGWYHTHNTFWKTKHAHTYNLQKAPTHTQRAHARHNQNTSSKKIGRAHV